MLQQLLGYIASLLRIYSSSLCAVSSSEVVASSCLHSPLLLPGPSSSSLVELSSGSDCELWGRVFSSHEGHDYVTSGMRGDLVGCVVAGESVDNYSSLGVEEDSSHGVLELEFSPPRPWRRERPKKNLAGKQASTGALRRPRGRLKKSNSEEISNAPTPASPPSPCGPYFTRATKAWFLGKYAGLVFPGSDEEAIRGLAEELKESWHVSL